mmetsp:Transcript_27063/g.85046  ORF Transcript_27063/g.85046 Transcript_27063/m.85046 type:complete len:847 (-) Transcript_27063:51-2591(-)
MVEELSARNAELGEEKGELRGQVKDLEAALEVAEEMEETQAAEIKALARDLARAEANADYEANNAAGLRRQLASVTIQISRHMAAGANAEIDPDLIADAPEEPPTVDRAALQALQRRLEAERALARQHELLLRGALTQRWAWGVAADLRAARLREMVPDAFLGDDADGAALQAEAAGAQAALGAAGVLEALLRAAGAHPEQEDNDGEDAPAPADGGEGAAYAVLKAEWPQQRSAAQGQRRLGRALGVAAALARGAVAKMTVRSAWDGAADDAAASDDAMGLAASLHRPLEALVSALSDAVAAVAESGDGGKGQGQVTSGIEGALGGLQEALCGSPASPVLAEAAGLLLAKTAAQRELQAAASAPALRVGAPALLVDAVLATADAKRGMESVCRAHGLEPEQSPALVQLRMLWQAVATVYQAAATAAFPLADEEALRSAAAAFSRASDCAAQLLALADGAMSSEEPNAAPITKALEEDLLGALAEAFEALAALQAPRPEGSAEAEFLPAIASLHPSPLSELRAKVSDAAPRAFLVVGALPNERLRRQQAALAEASATAQRVGELEAELEGAQDSLMDTRKALAAAQRRRETLEGESGRLRESLDARAKTAEELSDKLQKAEQMKAQLEERLVKDTQELEDEIKLLKTNAKSSKGGQRGKMQRRSSLMHTPTSTPGDGGGDGAQRRASVHAGAVDHREFFSRMLATPTPGGQSPVRAGSPAAKPPLSSSPTPAAGSAPLLAKRYMSEPASGGGVSPAGTLSPMRTSYNAMAGAEELEQLKSVLARSRADARKWQGLATQVLIGPALLPLPEVAFGNRKEGLSGSRVGLGMGRAPGRVRVVSLQPRAGV